MLEAENIKGFSGLNASKEMFKSFCENFYNAWGTDARATLKPLSVKVCKDAANGPYLRFDYMMYGKKCWLHVTGSRTWY